MRAAPALFMAALAGMAVLAYRETAANLEARGVRTGFGFLREEAGFAIGEFVPLPAFDGPGASFAVGAVVLAATGLLLRLTIPSLQSGAGRRVVWLMSSASLAIVATLLAAGSASLRFVDRDRFRQYRRGQRGRDRDRKRARPGRRARAAVP
jgi:ABC-type amino acid transport system permease subunit